MTDAKMDEIRGRVIRELEEAQRRVAMIESELNRIGNSFISVGTKLTDNPPNVPSLDKATVEKDIAALWRATSEYDKAIQTRSQKTDEWNKIRQSNS